VIIGFRHSPSVGGRFWCDSARCQGLQVTRTLLWKPLSGVVSAGYIFRAPETGKAAAFLVNGLLTMKQESPG